MFTHTLKLILLLASFLFFIPASLLAGDPPDNPVLVAPDDQASGVTTSPLLTVAVTDPESDPMTVTFFGRKKNHSGESFTIVGLPDTQYYTGELYGGSTEIFNAQTQWIVDNLSTYNIAFVTHLGDCTENADNFEIEWQRADAAMTTVENPVLTLLADGIPYGIAVGNHDQTPFGDPYGTTVLYNAWFGESRFINRAYYGGHYGSNNDNHYQLFSAGGMDFIVIHLEYDPAQDVNVLNWADNLLKYYSKRRAIVVSHFILSPGNPGFFVPQGLAIYNGLKANPNLFLMLGAHWAGEGRRTDTWNGNTVHSLLADYQDRTNGGDGWMRIMEFFPATNTIQVKTYSPWLDQWETDADSEFTLTYEMSDSWMEIGSNENVPSGSNTSISWPALEPLTEYEWYVEVQDGGDPVSSSVWSFTTADEAQQYTVNTSVSGPGTVSIQPGITAYDLNELVQLTAVPGPDSEFIEWTGDLSGSENPASLLVTGNKQVTAVFSVNNALAFDGVNDYVTFGEARGPCGYLANAPVWVTETGISPPPAGNHALQFDGTDQYVSLGSPENLGTRSFTVECWFKRTGTGTPSSTGDGGITNLVPLLSKGAPEGEGNNLDMNFVLGILDGGSGDSFIAGDFEDLGGSPNNHPKSGTTPILLNTWYHAAITFDNVTKAYTLYLNGQTEGSAEVLSGIVAQWDSRQHGALATMLESDGTTAHGFFQGIIDEPRIWNYARSQGEIQSAMHQELTKMNGLTGRWGLNEGSGNVIQPGDNRLGLATFTLEAWIKRQGSGVQASTGTGGVDAIPLITKGRDEADGDNRDVNYFLGINNNAASGPMNALTADFEDFSGSGNNHAVVGTTPLANDVWYHVAATYDGTSLKLYLNGTLDGSVTPPSGSVPRFDCIQHAAIGTALNSTGAAQGVFDGKMEEIRIWDHERTQDELRMDMHRPLENPSSEPGLVAYYSCNRTNGTNLPDISSSNNSGDLTNMDAGSVWVLSNAPVPYHTVLNGDWDTDAVWESGQGAPVNVWSRVHIDHAVQQTANREVIDLEISATGSLTVNPANNLTVTENLVNDAGVNGLVLQADDTGMASLIHDADNIQATAELYLTNDVWHYASSSIQNGLSDVFTGQYLRGFSESIYDWNPYITLTTTPLKVMNGYAVWQEDIPATVSFRGTLNNGTQNIGITATTPQSNVGWNLVGNPFASSLDWDAPGWDKTNIDNTVYFWEGTGGSGGTGNYHYYVGSGGTGPDGTWDPVAVNDASNEIPPMQGFFVKAHTSGSFSVTNEARIHSGQAYYKKSASQTPLIRLTATFEGRSDETVIRFFDGADADYDGSMDAWKLFADDCPQLYTTTGGHQKLAVNTLPGFDEETLIPVGFIAPKEGIHSLSMTELENFPENQSIYLEDLQTGFIGEIIDSTVYEFYAGPTGDPDRFLLHFSNPDNLEGLGSKVQIYSYGQVIVVQNASAQKGTIRVYNMLGKALATYTVEENSEHRFNLKASPGIYTVYFQLEGVTIAEKLLLN